MPKHPNKHIREAIEYARAYGWRLIKKSRHAHMAMRIFWQSYFVRLNRVKAVFSTFIRRHAVRNPAGFGASLTAVTHA